MLHKLLTQRALFVFRVNARHAESAFRDACRRCRYCYDETGSWMKVHLKISGHLHCTRSVWPSWHSCG